MFSRMKRENVVQFTEILIETLVRERKAKGVSHEKLAALAGVSRQAIGKIEAGERNPTMLTIYKLANGLGMTLAEFVGAMNLPDRVE